VPAAAPGDPTGPARAAAALAFASAAVSLFWTVGGTWLLDTLGGELERLARERAPGTVALGAAVVMLKAATGVAGLTLARAWRHGPVPRPVMAFDALAGGVLALWGAANVLAGSLALLGVLPGPAADDERALRWHVLLWDPWFLLWGALLLVAVARARPTGRRRPRRRPRPVPRGARGPT